MGARARLPAWQGALSHLCSPCQGCSQRADESTGFFGAGMHWEPEQASPDSIQCLLNPLWEAALYQRICVGLLLSRGRVCSEQGDTRG